MNQKQEREKEKLIREEQEVLDSVIQKMDQRMMELDRRLTEAQLRVQKNRGWADAYGALIDAQRDKADIQKDKKYLRMAQNDLYKYHIKLDYQDLDNEEDNGEYDLKVGMHTYMKGGEIYVLRWSNIACRPFIIDNSLEETDEVIDGCRTHLQLKLKRDIDLDFDEVVDVLHLFPLVEGDEAVIYDSFLQELVKRRSEQEFKNIVFSIQKKQGEIVQIPYKENLIVQGCAGSGKSMIMLHRLPILLEDNPGVLVKNSIYVVSPSTQYIQMMEGLREDLEIRDLKMGTIDDYYRYSIERYRHNISECGRINPLLGQSKAEMDYVYGSENLPRLIQYFFDEQIKEGERDLAFGQQFFGVKEREGNHQTVKDHIHKKQLMIQDILNENETRLRDQSRAIQELFSSYQQLEQTLRSRRIAEDRAIAREIQEAKDTINYQEQEIKRLNPVLNIRAIRNRRTIIRTQQETIKRLEAKRAALEKEDYYDKLANIAEETHSFFTGINIGEDPDNHREQYKSIPQYKKAREKYIGNMYSILQLQENIEGQINELSLQLQQLQKPSGMRAESYEAQLSAFQNAAYRLFAPPQECLPYDYYTQLQTASSYYNTLSESIPILTYMKIMDRLGYRPDQKGSFNVPSSAPYILLKILAAYNGPVDNQRESLVAIDEAQNYTLEEIKLFREINGDSVVLNLFGDIYQKVENEKGLNTWDELLELGTFQRQFLKENYRNALQITVECKNRFGIEMEPINVNGTGVAEYNTLSEMKEAIKNRLRKASSKGLRCILVKHREEAERFIADFKEYENRINDLTDSQSELSRSKWNLLLISRAKGLEFESVIALSGRMTRNEKYIAFTRALDELIIFDQPYGELAPIREEKTTIKEEPADSPKKVISEKPHKKQAVQSKKEPQPSTKSELVAYLLSKGCEVVDARSTSGRLWVIDTGTQTKQIVRSAIREFNVSFAKGKDQETNGRTGWYTKSNK